MLNETLIKNLYVSIVSNTNRVSCCSDTDGHEKGGTTLDPVLLRRLAKLEVDVHHPGIARNVALPDRIVVRGAYVDVRQNLRTHLDGLELDDRHEHIELHNLRLAEALLLLLPLSTLKVEAVDVGAILRALLELLNLLRLGDEFELKLVDRRGVLLSREALEERGGETGREGEGTDPEANRLALSHPRFEEIVTKDQIFLPVAQRLGAEVGEVPLIRHLVLSEGAHHLLELGREELETLYT